MPKKVVTPVAPVAESKKVKEKSLLETYQEVSGVIRESVLAVFPRTGYDILVLDAADQASYTKFTQDFEVTGTSRFVDNVQAGDAGDEMVLVIKK